MSHPGGCACGAVRYRLIREPMFVNCCHCRDCQRQTGGAFVVNAIIETDQIVRETGETVVFTMPTESGRPHDLVRCATCATTLWSDYGRRRVVSFVRVMTLDDPTALSPDAHIFTRSKSPWVEVIGAPCFEVYYETATLWSADGLARRRAVIGDG